LASEVENSREYEKDCRKENNSSYEVGGGQKLKRILFHKSRVPHILDGEPVPPRETGGKKGNGRKEGTRNKKWENNSTGRGRRKKGF